jgi:post-segregation antitoxin (ccd killing protein)
MTTITLEVPDELAAQFRITPAALSALIREAVAAKVAKLSPPDGSDESAPPIYQEMIDLLTSGPTADQLLAFKISESAQERLEELLRKNREEELTAEERADLNTYIRLSEYLTKLKARARAGQPLLG